MGKATYSNRYESINRVVNVVGQSDGITATEISKVINLSRQNILDVLKHAKTWGYVDCTEEPYRYRKDGSVLVRRKVWVATDYGKSNAGWFVSAMEKYKSGKGMKPLL